MINFLATLITVLSFISCVPVGGVNKPGQKATEESNKNQDDDLESTITPNPSQTEESATLEVNYTKPTPYTYPNDYNDPNLAPTKHMIIWGENPASEATIHWSLNQYNSNQTHMVYLSEKQQNGLSTSAYEMSFPATDSGLANLCGNSLASIQAKLTGLKPNTTYFYITESNGQKSQEMHFVTAPASDNVSFKIFSGGDSRSESAQRKVMNSQLSELLSQDPSYIVLVHGGDFVATGSNCDQWETWLDDHQRTITSDNRVLPIIATFGNHETGGERHYTALFGDPLGNESFYFHSKVGALDLIILNSEISVEGNQRDWLISKLQELKPTAKFMIAGYHSPAWPAQKNPARTTAWIPMFEQYKLDLIFESDGHTLKQTCPILNNRCDAQNGVIYVGEGGLGVSQREAAQAGQWYFEEGGYAVGQHHIQSLEFNMKDQVPTLNYSVFYDDEFKHPLNLKLRDR